MKDLKFSYNWNRKLRNKCFSTIRIWQPDKYRIGDIYQVFEKQKYLGRAELVDATRFELKHITEGMSLLDTGYSKKAVQNIISKMYPKYLRRYGDKAQFGFYIFRYEEPQQKTIS